MSTYSNEEKPLSIKEINNYLIDKLGITLDRRTIYGYIKDMRALGLQVSEYDKNKDGYYLKSDLSKQSESNVFSNIVYVNTNGNSKISYEEIPINTNQLGDSMKQNKKVVFNYKEEINEAIEEVNDEKVLNKYIVDPTCLILNKDNYYFVFIDSSSEKIRNFLANRISNASISEESMISTKDIIDMMNTKVYVKEKVNKNVFKELLK